MPNRNWSIIEAIAEQMESSKEWGELWFGNLGGETPTVGGDKSSRFMTTAQHLLTMRGYDVHLLSPLRSMDKTDLVRWWAARDRLDVLARTKSCFDPVMRACGRCQTCFRKLVAFTAAGHGEVLLWDQQPEWQPFVDKYAASMREAMSKGDWSRYSPARCRDTLAVIDAL
jgi:7-cyano-7-deazaguanine synthase in queuosine biosynthesis